MNETTKTTTIFVRSTIFENGMSSFIRIPKTTPTNTYFSPSLFLDQVPLQGSGQKLRMDLLRWYHKRLHPRLSMKAVTI